MELSIRDRENYLNNKLPRWTDSIIISPHIWNKWGEGIQEALVSHANFDSLFLLMENEKCYAWISLYGYAMEFI